MAGGLAANYLASAQLYNAATGSFTVKASMRTTRELFTATLLDTGEVLIPAGTDAFNSAELYDPASGTFSITESLNIRRTDHSAVLLRIGQARWPYEDITRMAET
jgi:hypothetical protein